jgi:hypothetical protein
METILEIQRRCHEERERLVKAMVDEFMTKKPPGKEQIYSDHRVKLYLNVSFFLFCCFIWEIDCLVFDRTNRWLYWLPGANKSTFS